MSVAGLRPDGRRGREIRRVRCRFGVFKVRRKAQSHQARCKMPSGTDTCTDALISKGTSKAVCPCALCTTGMLYHSSTRGVSYQYQAMGYGVPGIKLAEELHVHRAFVYSTNTCQPNRCSSSTYLAIGYSNPHSTQHGSRLLHNPISSNPQPSSVFNGLLFSIAKHNS